MDSQPGNNSMKDIIDRSLQEKETEELLDIWRENDHDQWTAEAFDAVRAILIQRGVELPSQETPHEEEEMVSEEIEEETEEDEIYTDEENKLLKLVSWADMLSYIVIAVGAIRSIILIARFISTGSAQEGFVNIASLLLQLLDYLINYGFFYFVLKAVSEIIYLLIDMQHSLQPVDPGSEE